MGSWGYDAMDSDSASQWQDDLTSVVAKSIKKTLTKRRSEPEHVRAASATIIRAYKCQFLIEDQVMELVPLAIDALEGLLDDSGWIESFDEPGSAKRSITKQIEGLVRLHEKVVDE